MTPGRPTPSRREVVRGVDRRRFNAGDVAGELEDGDVVSSQPRVARIVGNRRDRDDAGVLEVDPVVRRIGVAGDAMGRGQECATADQCTAAIEQRVVGVDRHATGTVEQCASRREVEGIKAVHDTRRHLRRRGRGGLKQEDQQYAQREMTPDRIETCLIAFPECRERHRTPPQRLRNRRVEGAG